MTHEALDKIFPFVVFYYGLIMTLALNLPMTQKLAEKYLMPDLLRQMNAHRGLALVCLFVGSFWTLQNIWYYN